MNEGMRFGKFICILLTVLVAGCVSLTYKSSDGKQFTYSRLGGQSIKGLTVNQVGNSMSVSFASSQSDTQELTSAISSLAGKVK